MTPALRSCPVCNAGSNAAKLFLEENIDRAGLSQFSFASRKTPEYMCHHLVRCEVCDLVYADRPPSADALAQAYHDAGYDSAQEAADAAAAYVRVARPVLARLPRRDSALEIGTGTGVFLECLEREGFSTLVGVEPSAAAIGAAPPERRAWIRQGVFREADFQPAAFDLVCCFMTLEHVSDPQSIAQAVLRLLRPGGAFIAVAHDHRAAVNRLLGKRSPIIDIEHLQLFSRASLRRLFEAAGYERVSVQAFANRYRIGYWLRLAPLPASLKSGAGRVLERTGVAGARLSLNVGNLFAAGFKRG